MIIRADDATTSRQAPEHDLAAKFLHARNGTGVRHATPADVPYIDALRKKEGDALGFIPLQRYHAIVARSAFPHETLYVTEDNGDLTGFVYASHADRTSSIWQIVVQEDARRWTRALLMLDVVEREAVRRNSYGVKCRVAADIEANHFWRAAGYVPASLVTSSAFGRGESKSKRQLIVYYKTLGHELFGPDTYTLELAS